MEFPGALYHVMSRGVGGNATYGDDDDRIRFLDGIGALIKTGVLIVHAFCLMTTHFHLLCETPIGRLGRWMQQLLSRYSTEFNRRHSRLGHMWQARYKAILVEPGKHFLDCSRYIHLNPVRAAMARCPEEYVWSSYRSHLGLYSVVDWVSTERVLSEAGGLDGYRDFVEAGLASDEKSPFERAQAGVFFGDKEFVNKMRALIQQPVRPGDLSGYGSLDHLQTMPAEHLRAIVDDVLQGWSGCRRTKIEAFLLRRLSTMTGREIARMIGKSEATVSEAWHDVEGRTAADKEWRDQMDQLCTRFSLRVNVPGTEEPNSLPPDIFNEKTPEVREKMKPEPDTRDPAES